MFTSNFVSLGFDENFYWNSFWNLSDKFIFRPMVRDEVTAFRHQKVSNEVLFFNKRNNFSRVLFTLMSICFLERNLSLPAPKRKQEIQKNLKVCWSVDFPFILGHQYYYYYCYCYFFIFFFYFRWSIFYFRARVLNFKFYSRNSKVFTLATFAIFKRQEVCCT
jgi:hypothetical protein